MFTNPTITRPSSEPVSMRLIVDRQTDAFENITLPCGRNKYLSHFQDMWVQNSVHYPPISVVVNNAYAM